MERIGVRELRQHASRYLARVARGESLEVTDRGRPVAHLVPIQQDPWQELISTGRVVPAGDDADLLDEPPQDYGANLSLALVRQREKER